MSLVNADMSQDSRDTSQDDPLEPEVVVLEPGEIVQAARAKLARWERLEELRETGSLEFVRHGVSDVEPGEEFTPEQTGRIVLKAMGDVYSQVARVMARRHGYLMGGYEIPDGPGAGYWLYESD